MQAFTRPLAGLARPVSVGQQGTAQADEVGLARGQDAFGEGWGEDFSGRDHGGLDPDLERRGVLAKVAGPRRAPPHLGMEDGVVGSG